MNVRIAEGDVPGEKESSSLPDSEGLLMKEDEEIRVEYTLADTLTAPVVCGMSVGRVDYIVDDQIYRTECIVTAENLEEIDQEWCMRQVLERFVLP